MSASTHTTIRFERRQGAIAQPDRRRHKRFRKALGGRYLRVETKQEFACEVVDISVGGARLIAPEKPEVDERIVVYFDELGGYEGRVARVSDDGFAIEFTASQRRRQKLAAQITWFVNRHELSSAEQRRPRHDRVAVPPKPVSLALEDGSIVQVHVIDISISGASVAMKERPPVGSTVIIDNLPAEVVRHHARGIGVEFAQIQEFEAIRNQFS